MLGCGRSPHPNIYWSSPCVCPFFSGAFHVKSLGINARSVVPGKRSIEQGERKKLAGILSGWVDGGWLPPLGVAVGIEEARSALEAL
jgi:hypothetical protein